MIEAKISNHHLKFKKMGEINKDIGKFLRLFYLKRSMGVKLPGILPVKTISWEELKGKKIGVDFSNCIYQFLSSIRQRDGTLLMDSKGRITSHLSGLFYRSSNLM